MEHLRVVCLFVIFTGVCQGLGNQGGDFQASHGTITSPNYPEPYPENLQRDWVIEAPEGHVVTLNVMEFEIEWGPGCDYDYLEIRSGNTISTSVLLGKYCGDEIDDVFTSIGNKIFLHFKSDNGISGYQGFVIEWDITSVGNLEGGADHTRGIKLSNSSQNYADCGGNLTTSHGTISTPNYPEPYKEDIDCIWNIRVSAGSIIQLILVHLEFDEIDDCRFDSVEIYDGVNKLGKKLGTYCQRIYHPMYIETTSNVASVVLRSNSTSSQRVHMIYHTLFHNKLHGSHGVIESPNYPNKYPHRENCNWTIEAPIGSTLNLKFSVFDLDGETASSCNVDYLKIAEGNGGVPNREIGKFCNSNAPPHMIVSTQNQFFLQFHSDNPAPRNGFILEWNVIVNNLIPPPSHTCLLWNDPVSKRDDYTYKVGIGGYKLHTETVTWNKARITCEEEGGYLAIINSDAELNTITELFNTTDSRYLNLTSIGFHDLYEEGEFVTIHGQSLGKTGFFRWEDGQPNDDKWSENCGALSISGELNDVSCQANNPFICEIPIY